MCGDRTAALTSTPENQAVRAAPVPIVIEIAAMQYAPLLAITLGRLMFNGINGLILTTIKKEMDMTIGRFHAQVSFG